MSAKESEMLMHIVLLQVLKLLGATEAIDKAYFDNDGLRRLQAIGVYRSMREEINRRDERKFGLVVKPLVSVTWEELRSLLGELEQCDAEILIGCFSLETDELFRYAHGRRHCLVSDVFNVEAYPTPWTALLKHRPAAHFDNPLSRPYVQRRAKGDSAMVHVACNVADEEMMVVFRYDFFVRSISG